MLPGDAANAGTTRGFPAILCWTAVVLLATRLALGVYIHLSRAKPAELIEWKPIKGAEAEAKKSGKPVLYDFTAEWCPPCRVMQKEVFGSGKGAALINSGFYPVRVPDLTREKGVNPSEVTALQRRFKVNSFPTLVIVPVSRGAAYAAPVIVRGYPGKRALLKALEEAGGNQPQGLARPTRAPAGSAHGRPRR
jgi:thiol:disulfide interchange protein